MRAFIVTSLKMTSVKHQRVSIDHKKSTAEVPAQEQDKVQLYSAHIEAVTNDDLKSCLDTEKGGLYVTITSQIVVYAPAERAETFSLFPFSLESS
jgi:hypothetical protein